VTTDLEFLRRSFRDVPACRVATIRADGGPHVASRWFVWLDDALYVSTRVGDPTWEAVTRDPRVSAVIDRGRDWVELSGVRLNGVATPLPPEHVDLRAPMATWHEKYRSMLSGDGFEHITRQIPELGILRIVPEEVDAWDHR
jgi:hypothetical protein